MKLFWQDKFIQFGWKLMLLTAFAVWTQPSMAAPPEAADQSVEVSEGGSTNITLNGDSGNGFSLRFSIIDSPDHGALSCNLTRGCTSAHAFNYNSEADIDDGSCRFTSCRQLRLSNTELGSGNYTIDPDGNGPKGEVTAYCDMTTDGGGYTFINIDNGKRTYTHTDDNSCKDMGMDIVVPRTKEHWRAMLDRYGSSYFDVVPGIYKPSGGGNYTGFAMNSSSVPDWKAVDDGPWFLRDTPFGEPNGDYFSNCWLNMYGYDVNDLRFNDYDCNYSTNRYICSTNDKFGAENLSNRPGSCADILRDDPDAASGTYTIYTNNGATQVEAYCDMTTDGGGYTMVPIDNGIQTSRSTDNNTCKTMGMDIAVPRTKEHLRAMINRYGSGYFSVAPGVSKPSGGGNYTGFAMNSNSVADWRAVDGGSWFLRDSPYSEPNGDYEANCWLGTRSANADDFTFNDGNCGYSTSRYICSTNDKDGPVGQYGNYRSCKALKVAHPDAPTGTYRIQPRPGVSVNAYCDMTTDGGGYTMVPVDDGIRTYRSIDDNSCRDMGMDIIVPRTKEHLRSMINRFGSRYFEIVPGVTKNFGGGNYTDYPMNSGVMPDWKAVDGGSFFLRDTTMSEPSGDYTANCWLGARNVNADNFTFNDDDCIYSSTNYLCSTNDKDDFEGLDDPASCAEIKREDPDAASGDYFINPKGHGRLQVYCDMTTDGGGYDYFPIDNGTATSRVGDNNSCRALGMEIAVPRTKEHLRAMINRYGNSYFGVAPGIYKPFDGGNYTGFAMNSNSVADWRAIDGGSWFLRDSNYSEPSGDYTHHCWLGTRDANPDNFTFNDGNCGYSTSRYICSTNAKDGPVNLPKSCLEVLQRNPNATSGDYRINPGQGEVTAYCDMTTDGGGYTMVPIENGKRTYRSTDSNTCKDMGMDIAVPRTKAHFKAMLDRYGTGYFNVVPGIMKPYDGGNYTNNGLRYGAVNDWQAVDGGSWFLRDYPYSEPNGDYTANCWLLMYDWNINDMRFNDGNCSYSTTRYVCSPNDKDPHLDFGKFTDEPQPEPSTSQTCTYTAQGDYFGPDSFTFQITDDSGRTDTGTVNINVTNINDPPVANAQSVSVREDNSINVTLTATDPDSNNLSFSVISSTSFGALTGTAPNLTYTPAQNFSGADSFSFSVSDGEFTRTATVNISVTPENDPPSANAQSVALDEDSDLDITITATDPDGTQPSLSITDQPDHGSLTGTPPNLNYEPNDNFNGSDSFTFSASDGSSSDSATVNITVRPINDLPTATGRTVNGSEDTDLNVALVANDVDGDNLTYTITDQPDHGSLTGTAPNLTYTPNNNFSGSDSFIFTVNDGAGDSNPATMTLNIADVNDAPTANGQDVETDEDTSLNITLTGNDEDGDNLTFNVVSNPSNGSLSGTAPNLTYTPNNNFAGNDNFIFRVNDGRANSGFATVNITVNSVNDPPQATGQVVALDEDTDTNITLVASDLDGDNLTYAIDDQPDHGTLTGTPPNLNYEPNDNFNGSDSFTFTANDGRADSAPATVNITVRPTNDPPTVAAGAERIDEDSSASITLVANDLDGDNLTYTITDQPDNGSLTGTAPNLTYTPDNNFNGRDSFTFKVNDGQVDSQSATVDIDVDPVNDQPTANALAVQTDEDVQRNIILTGTDPEDDSLTFTLVTQPRNGSLSGTAPNLTYTPNSHFNGDDSFAFTVNDGDNDSTAATVDITVDPVNDPPTTSDQDRLVNFEEALAVTLTGDDADNDDLTFTVLTQPGSGSLTGTAPNLTYTPSDGFSGNDSFTFSVSDGQESANGTVSLRVRNTSLDPPVVSITTDGLWFSQDTRVEATITETGCSTAPTLGADPQSISLSITEIGGGQWAVTSAPLSQGTYPVTITATSTCSDKSGNDSLTFGVDTTDALVIYSRLPQNGVAPNDVNTWPNTSKNTDLSTTVLARDTLSGLAQITSDLFDFSVDPPTSVRLADVALNARSGQPSTGVRATTTSLCSHETLCSDGALRVPNLESDLYMLRITTTDVADNEVTQDFYFRIASLRPSIVTWRDAIGGLSSDTPAAQDALDSAFAKLDLALRGLDEEYYGNMVLACEDAQALMRVAKLLDNNLDTDDEALGVATEMQRFLAEELNILREIRNLPSLLDTSESYLDRANAQISGDAPGDAFLEMANAFFWMQHARVQLTANNFQTSLTTIGLILDEMDSYVAQDPTLPGASDVQDARDDLTQVDQLVNRVVFNGPISLTDREHLELLTGLADTAERLKDSEESGVWVRNWQWGLTQVTYIFAERGFLNASAQLGQSLMVDETSDQLERAEAFRNDFAADDFMRLLIDSRCVMIGFYNLAYEPDAEVPAACCEDMVRYNGLDSRIPVPGHCQ